tara:strand:- start:8600 stop:9445 length:846 start_codon:yes stop_codon:yes gene_type:complete
MKWRQIPNGVEYDWNDSNNRWTDLKTEIEDIPKSAVKRHSLSNVHLGSQVCWADSDAKHGQLRGVASRGPSVRGLWKVGSKTWHGTGEVSGTYEDDVGMVAEVHYSDGVTSASSREDGGIDLYDKYYKGQTWLEEDSYDPSHAKFRTNGTGVLVMAEIEIQSATFKEMGSHIAGGIVAYLGSTTSYTADFIPQESIRFIRQNHEDSNQRIEMSWRYMLNWDDFAVATRPPFSYDIDDIRILKGVGLALWGADDDMKIYYKNARLSALCLDHGHCIRSAKGV